MLESEERNLIALYSSLLCDLDKVASRKTVDHISHEDNYPTKNTEIIMKRINNNK